MGSREYPTPTLDISIRIHTVFCRSISEEKDQLSGSKKAASMKDTT